MRRVGREGRRDAVRPRDPDDAHREHGEQNEQDDTRALHCRIPR
jgi:hypothetical protein